MRHLIVGAVLVLAALAITSVTAELLERAAINQRDRNPSPTLVPNAVPSPTANPSRPAEPGRRVTFASHRLADD